ELRATVGLGVVTGPLESLDLACELDLHLDIVLVTTYRPRNLGEIVDALAGDDIRGARRHAELVAWDLDLPALLGEFAKFSAQGVVEPVDPIVVEAARHRAEDGNGLIRDVVADLAVASHLLAHVAKRVFRTFVLVLVDRYEVGDVEHLDLLELTLRTVLGGHDVQGHVGHAFDLGVALADAARLDDDEVVASELAESN